MSTNRDPRVLNAATEEWYNAHPEVEDNRLRAHHIEFEVTLRAIILHLPDRPGLKILDIGGGTGPYSFALAARGHSVTLVDLSPGLLSLARTRAASLPSEAQPTCILEGDATTLSSLPSLEGEHGSFDAVLLLGPLYHIMDPALRDAAIREAWSMVRPGCGDAADGGGTLFCAWVCRWAHYRDIALRDPGRLLARKEVYTQHARDGNYVRLDEQGVAYHAMHHELPANMPRMLARVTERPKEEVHMVGTESVLTVGLDKLVNEMQGEEFEAWVQKCYEGGTDESGWMMADHIVGFVSKS